MRNWEKGALPGSETQPYHKVSYNPQVKTASIEND